MRIIELILDEEQEESGIEAISIVESPAIESDFVALSAEEIKLAEVDKEKKIFLKLLQPYLLRTLPLIIHKLVQTC